MRPSATSGDGPGDPVFRELALDVDAERELRVFRAVAGVVVGAVAVFVVALSPDWRGWLCGGVSVLFAVGWAAAARAARRRLERPEDWRLVLAPEGLTLHEGRAGARRIPWSDVRTVAVDEERLVVEVGRVDGPPVRVEPRFGGLGVYDLAGAIERARDAAR